MNIPLLKRPNTNISHDRLNFKRTGHRIYSDRRDELYVFLLKVIITIDHTNILHNLNVERRH